MDGNYIKLCRSILNWEWYGDEHTTRVFVHCLLKANWKDGRFEGMEIPRGSFVTSVAKLSEELSLTPKQIRTALDHLKKTGEVAIKTTNKFSVVTVKNYGQYQDEGKQRANKGQTKGNQTANKGQTKGNNRRKEERKNGNREERKKEIYYPNDEKLDQAFRDFVEMREFIKSPMTDRAITMAMNKLEELTKNKVTGTVDNDLAIRIVEESIVNNWKSFYPLKNNNRKSTSWEDA